MVRSIQVSDLDFLIKVCLSALYVIFERFIRGFDGFTKYISGIYSSF